MQHPPPTHPLTAFAARHPLLLVLLLGCVLTGLCALAGPLLTPPALARWTFHIREEDEMRALLGLIGIRHLPIFLLAVTAGQVIFRLVRNTAPRTVASASLPYLLYLIVQGVLDSSAAGEAPFSWVTYEPAYFIWPHFLTVPLGLAAAAHMVARARRGAPDSQ